MQPELVKFIPCRQEILQSCLNTWVEINKNGGRTTSGDNIYYINKNTLYYYLITITDNRTLG